MKLFSKEIDKKLYKQYPKGADLSSQVAVAKIFNPYGKGRWYLINSDPEDPNYLWAIVQMGDIVEVGSVSRNELESLRIPPFRLPLERDLGFGGVNAAELFKGLRAGKFYKAGGWTEDSENKQMLLNQAEGFEHHAEEFESAVKKADYVPAWVVAKSQRASTDLSDITHYLDGENEQKEEEMEGEEEYADGGEVKWQDAHYGDNALVVSENKMGIIIKPYGRKFHLKFADGTEKTYDASELKFFKDIDEFDRGGEVKSYNAMYFKEITTRDGSKMEVMRDRSVFNGSLENVLSRAYNGFYPTDKYVVIKDREKDAIIARLNSDGKGEVFYEGYGINKGEIELEKEVEEVEEKPKKKLFGIFSEGGEVDGVDLFEDYENIPANVQEVLDKYADAFEGGDYRDLEKANKALLKIGYTFEYGLDGQAYDLRKVGEKGKSESYAKGGEMAKGGKIYKIQVKDSHDIKPKWEDDTWHTGGKKYLSFKDAKVAVKKLQGDTAYAHKEFKVVEDKEKMAEGGKVGKTVMYQGKKAKIISKKGDMYFVEIENYHPNGDSLHTVIRESEIDKMAMGGKVKFADKVKSIKASLLKRKKVSPKVQKDYGKTYSPKEAEESAKRIVGAMTAKERLMVKRKKGKK